MKATGMIRRVDELGRIVIPKEIRRNLGIRAGDPMEIYSAKAGLVLRRYVPALSVADSLRRLKDQIEDEPGMQGPSGSGRVLRLR